jgi:hypothetical protein
MSAPSNGLTRADLLIRGLALGAGFSGLSVARAFADVRDDLALLNFLLGVEYVQAALYRDALKDVPGMSNGVARLARELRDHEIAHVDALRATISDAGGRPANRPSTTFGGELRTEARFLKVANTLEDTAVSAYNGTAPQFESKELVAAAASIVQVEARHSALIREARGKPPAPLGFDKDSSMDDVRARIRRYELR